VQLFERRALTYAPANPGPFQVEFGNIGQHYLAWIDSNQPPPPGDTFSDGTWTVGTDIQAGTYRNSDSSSGCYWARLSGFGGNDTDVIAENFTDARQIVTISPGDAGFQAAGCGTWSADLSPITASPNTPFTDGMYQVGSEVAPGTWYANDPSDSCYWERLSSFSGELDDIISNGLSSDPQTVTIEPGDVGFATYGCGAWSMEGDVEPPDVPTEGEILYQSNLSDWETGPVENGTYSWDGSRFHISVTESGGLFLGQYTTTSYTDISASVDIKLEAGTGDGCLLVRADVSGDYDYALCVYYDPDSNAAYAYAIYEWFDSDGNYQNSPLAGTFVLDGADALTTGVNLKIIIKGTHLWFLINGELLGDAEYTDGSLSGSVGMNVVNYSDDNSEFSYTNLVIRALAN